ncbi:MAG: efflux RND transporter periplasmic adaptor subunit [Pseudodesulfovibrio sp.]
MNIKFTWLTIFLAALLFAAPAHAQKPGERPPSPVVTDKVTSGDMAPQSEYIGTVFFTEISDVASEVIGKVVDIKVIDGQRVKKGDVMVVLSATLLDKRIRRGRALAQQAKAQHEAARLDHERIATLFKGQAVAEGEFDSKRLTAEGLLRRYEAMQAEVSQLLEEASKKKIRAPYDGVVIEVTANRGEWMSIGTTVVVTARDDEFEVVVHAPREAFGVIEPGLKVGIKVAGEELPGEVFALIPKGNVASRTYPVKIRVENNGHLAEGMEARVILPKGLGGTTMIVSRDAVISMRGQQVVWAVLDGKAVPMPVFVIGFRGLVAGVKSDKLKEGMDIVVKGNERLQPGQAVAAQPIKKK